MNTVDFGDRDPGQTKLTKTDQNRPKVNEKDGNFMAMGFPLFAVSMGKVSVYKHQSTTAPWVVSWQAERRHRRFFRTQLDANREAARVRTELDEVGKQWAELPKGRKIGIVKTVSEIEDAGLTVEEVWKAYKAGQTPRVQPTVRIEDAVSQLLKAKREQGRRESYVDGLGAYLALFVAGRESVPVAHFTADHVREWFDSRAEKPATMASNIGRLASLFSFAKRRGWLTNSPIDQVDRPHTGDHAPTILTVDQCRKLMSSASADMIGYLSLALFAGIRPQEIERMTWSDIRMGESIATVNAAASKVRQRRTIHLHPTCMAWLATAPVKDGPIAPHRTTFRRRLRSMRDSLGLDSWPQDVLRHTAATHLLHHWQSAEKTALELGNSVPILLRHYRELVPVADSVAFWSILPARS